MHRSNGPPLTWLSMRIVLGRVIQLHTFLHIALALAAAQNAFLLLTSPNRRSSWAPLVALYCSQLFFSSSLALAFVFSQLLFLQQVGAARSSFFLEALFFVQLFFSPALVSRLAQLVARSRWSVILRLKTENSFQIPVHCSRTLAFRISCGLECFCSV